MKDLQPEKKFETESNFDFTEMFWNYSEESNKQLDSSVNDCLLAETPCIQKKSLFCSDVNFCKYDGDRLDNSGYPIELCINDYNPIMSPKNDDLFGITDMYNWNEVFNVSSNYLNIQQDDYPTCDYVKYLEDPLC
jgi:hypothetical protein